MGDQTIGQLLAGGPVGVDGVWPCEEVRDLLDELRAEHIGIGFTSGKYNRRGVTSRGVFDGGNQERGLAGKYQEDADKIRARWPYTAGLLQQMARGYRNEAQRNDQEAIWRENFDF